MLYVLSRVSRINSWRVLQNLLDYDPFLRRHCLQDGISAAVLAARLLPRILDERLELGQSLLPGEGFGVPSEAQNVLKFLLLPCGFLTGEQGQLVGRVIPNRQRIDAKRNDCPFAEGIEVKGGGSYSPAASPLFCGCPNAAVNASPSFSATVVISE